MFWGGDQEGEIHELAAVLILILAAIHVAGVAFESSRHHENLACAMINGRMRAGGKEAALDDGTTDGRGAIVRARMPSGPGLRPLLHAVGAGQSAAIRTGGRDLPGIDRRDARRARSQPAPDLARIVRPLAECRRPFPHGEVLRCGVARHRGAGGGRVIPMPGALSGIVDLLGVTWLIHRGRGRRCRPAQIAEADTPARTADVTH